METSGVRPGPAPSVRAEQAALRRVATLVARAAPPQEVFAAPIGQAECR
jgi:hypothetical protein